MKNSGNSEKYKFSYCFALLEKQFISSCFQEFLVVVQEELRRNEEKEKEKEREKRRKKDREKRNCN